MREKWCRRYFGCGGKRLSGNGFGWSIRNYLHQIFYPKQLLGGGIPSRSSEWLLCHRTILPSPSFSKASKKKPGFAAGLETQYTVFFSDRSKHFCWFFFSKWDSFASKMPIEVKGLFFKVLRNLKLVSFWERTPCYCLFADCFRVVMVACLPVRLPADSFTRGSCPLTSRSWLGKRIFAPWL